MAGGTKNLLSKMKRLVIVAIILSSLSSCSLMFEAIDISNRQSKEISEGDVVSGDGFTVRSPESGLYPSARDTSSGGVTLRPTQTFLDGMVYIVTPWKGSGASSPREAFDRWNEIPKAKGFTVVILEGTTTSFKGLSAYRSSVEVVKGASSQVVSMLVVKRSEDFLFLVAGHPNYPFDTRNEKLKYTQSALEKLELAAKITKK